MQPCVSLGPPTALDALSCYFCILNPSPPGLSSGVGDWSSLAVVTWKEVVLHTDSKSTSSFTLILITKININSDHTSHCDHGHCMDIYSVQRIKAGTEVMEASRPAQAGT